MDHSTTHEPGPHALRAGRAPARPAAAPRTAFTRPAYHPASAPDYVPVACMRELQVSRLRAMVARAHERVPLYRRRLDERGVTPEDIRSLGDIARLPFTIRNTSASCA